MSGDAEIWPTTSAPDARSRITSPELDSEGREIDGHGPPGVISPLTGRHHNLNLVSIKTHFHYFSSSLLLPPVGWNMISVGYSQAAQHIHMSELKRSPEAWAMMYSLGVGSLAFLLYASV